MSFSDKYPERPRFSDLPLDKGGPWGNAWGLFGKTDEVGLLNYITPQVTLDALKEVQHGIRVCTDLPLDFFKFPAFGRAPFHHEIRQVNDWAVTDDTVTFNPQSATQWDGFRHFGKGPTEARRAKMIDCQHILGYQDRKQYYQGIMQEQFQTSTRLGVNGRCKPGKGRLTTLTLEAWHYQGGIATRGVLLDFARWAEDQQLSRPALGANSYQRAGLA